MKVKIKQIISSHQYRKVRTNQCRLVTFQPGDAVQKTTLHFLKFYFNFRFFLQISSNRHHVRYFSNLTFKKYILRLSPQTDTALCE